MMRRVARTAGQTVGREDAHEADPVDLSRLLRAYRERPRRRRAAEQRDELRLFPCSCCGLLKRVEWGGAVLKGTTHRARWLTYACLSSNLSREPRPRQFCWPVEQQKVR